ncbi:MAG: DUF3795 domain-containing protein [Marinifilaceae bacterium]|jgi:hypothetical protein|nr:DUF3795 domain-containing protein [Marinilabiliaceae bacterium JC040]MCT4599985.1 DUF3795 domain-containing protein [Marinifilaceae bacterium]
MKDLIACCGLDCENCEARIATINDDDELREKTAKKWCEMNHTDLITKDSIQCMGCRTDGVKFEYCRSMCEIRKCVKKNGFNTCADCPKLNSCSLVGAIIKNNEDARKNLYF